MRWTFTILFPDLVNRHAIRHRAAQFPDRHGRHLPHLAGRRLCSYDTNGLDGNLLLRRRNANAYANRYADGNFKPDSYANGNGNIYAYAYGYGNVYSNADSYGHVYAYRDSYGDIHANGQRPQRHSRQQRQRLLHLPQRPQLLLQPQQRQLRPYRRGLHRRRDLGPHRRLVLSTVRN